MESGSIRANALSESNTAKTGNRRSKPEAGLLL
jgi:hypothetical protein